MYESRLVTKTIYKWNCSESLLMEKNFEIIQKMNKEIEVLRLQTENDLKYELELVFAGVNVSKRMKQRDEDIDKWKDCIYQANTITNLLIDYVEKGSSDFTITFSYPSNRNYLRRLTSYYSPKTNITYEPVSPVELMEEFLNSVNCYYDYISDSVPDTWHIKPQTIKETVQEWTKPSATELFKDYYRRNDYGTTHRET